MRKFSVADGKDTNFSCLQGYIRLNFAEIQAVLGEPQFGPDADLDGKVTCEWAIKFPDGTVATIYDWKMLATPFEEYNWHIGGHTDKAVELVNQLFNKE